MQERTASSHRLGGKGNLVLRPIRLTRHLFLGPLGIAVGVLILWATFTLPSPTVLLVMADILQLATGAFFLLGGLLMVLLPWIKSARLELSGRRLIFSGLLRQTILDLNEWGKATVVQTSEGIWLAFFTLEEERHWLPRAITQNQACSVRLRPSLCRHISATILHAHKNSLTR